MYLIFKMLTPKFWQKNSLVSVALLPLAMVYNFFYRTRCFLNRKPYKSEIPIICIGNLVIGGAGKTPTAVAIAKILKKRNKTFCFLSKGYKGLIKKPTRVDLNSHRAIDVGDEPLILANHGDVYVSHNRVEGLKYINNLVGKYDYIIMDDGLQNPTFFKNIAVAVVNGKYGFGNGLLFPAGPMRETLKQARLEIDRVLILDNDECNIKEKCDKLNIRYDFGEIKTNLLKVFYQNKFVAFSGIANPQKFFDTLEECCIKVINKISYQDHYFFSQKDLDYMYNLAENNGCRLLTTEKDWVRLKKEDRERILYLEIFIRILFNKKQQKNSYDEAE